MRRAAGPLLIGVLVGCGASKVETAAPPDAVAASAPAAAVVTSSEAPPAPIESSPTEATEDEPDRPEACELSATPDVPKLFRSLFEKGRRLAYAWKDDVDPHDPEGGRIVEKTKLDCVVVSVRKFREAFGSVLMCAREGSTVGAETLAFVANARGLWMLRDPVDDEEAAAAITSESRTLPSDPAPMRRTFEVPGQWTDLPPNRCVDSIRVDKHKVCREESCKLLSGGYGDTLERTCFSEAAGLETWHRENLEGPRTTTWKLTTATKGAPVPDTSALATLAACASP